MFDVVGIEGPVIIFIAVIGALTVGMFGFVVVKGLSQWRSNEASPLRSVDAFVVSRRSDVRHRQDRTDSTTYYVTFEEPSGERRELQVTGRDFGQFAEGDRGHLMHQGTRYKGFTRQTAVDGPR